MNKYENEAIKQQIFFERYKNGEAEEIVSLLDKSSAEIASFVKATKGVYTKARYKEIAKKMREISASLKDKVGENIDVEGVIEYELKKQKKLLKTVKNDIVNSKDGSINFLYPTTEQIKTAALFKPVTEGMTYDSYLNGIEEGMYNTWDSAVRTGYLTGQPTSKIVSNVMGGISPETKLANPGLINSLRNSVYSNTKTLLQSFAAETRNRVFEENEKYFGDGKSEYKYEWLSTLDSHTCLVCGNLDGKLFKSIEDAPAIPVHRGCRCILLPYFNIEGDTRASKNGYVSSKVTYSEWLDKQDEKTQKEVLGVNRYKMYKNGIRLNQFVDNGEIITLEKLNRTLVKSVPTDLEEIKVVKMSEEEFNELRDLFNGKNITLDNELQYTDKEGLKRLFDYIDSYDFNNSVTSIRFNNSFENGGMNMHFDGSLSLSRKSFSDIKSFDERIEKAVKAGLYPQNTTLEALFEHEVKGHGSERLLILKKYGTGVNAFNNGQEAWNSDELAGEVTRSALNKVKKIYSKKGISDIITIKRLVSENSLIRESEFMADAMVDCFVNKDNAQIISKAIKDVVLEMLGGK